MKIYIYVTEKIHGNVLNEKKTEIRYYNIKVQHWDVYWMETLDKYNKI